MRHSFAWTSVLILSFFLVACGPARPPIPVRIASATGDYRIDLSLPKDRLRSGMVILVRLPPAVRDVEVVLPAHFDGDFFIPPRTGTAKGSKAEKPFEEDGNWRTYFHLKPPESTGEVYAGNAVLHWRAIDIFIGLWYGPREKFSAAVQAVGYSYEEFLLVSK